MNKKTFFLWLKTGGVKYKQGNRPVKNGHPIEGDEILVLDPNTEAGVVTQNDNGTLGGKIIMKLTRGAAPPTVVRTRHPLMKAHGVVAALVRDPANGLVTLTVASEGSKKRKHSHRQVKVELL